MEIGGGKKKGDVKSVIYPVNQWMDSGENATEAAMARWAQDKELLWKTMLQQLKVLLKIR